MSSPRTQRLRVQSGFQKAADAVILSRGPLIVNGLTGNPAFPNPPIDPVSLKTALDRFSVAIGDAQDGGKRAIVEKRRQRDEIIRMLRVLGHYVEAECKDEMTTLLSSGFDPLIVRRAGPQPLAPASIRRIDQGNSGQLRVRIKSVPKAQSYELRYAALGANGPEGDWTFQPITAVLTPTSCSGLTPGVSG